MSEKDSESYDPNLKERDKDDEKQADLCLNHDLKMKCFVEEYNRLFLKFKEKEIECKGLKEKIESLGKGRNGKSFGVKEMMIKIGYLEDEYRKMETDERGKCAQLRMEIEGLKSEKLRADDEIEVLKVKCEELEVHGRVLLNEKVELGIELKKRDGLEGRFRETIKNLEEENRKMQMEIEELKSVKMREGDKCGILDRKGMELEVKATVSLNYSIELGENLNSQMLRTVGGDSELLEHRTVNEREKTAQDKVCCSKTDARVDVLHPKLTDTKLIEPDNKPSSLEGNLKDVRVPDLHYYINNQWEPSENDTDEKKNVCSGFTVESISAVELPIALEMEGNLGDSLVLLKQGAVNTIPIDVIEIEDEIIEVIDSEDEKEITAAHPCTVEGKELPHVSTDETFNASEKCLKSPFSLQRHEKCEASSGKVLLTPRSQLCSTPKRFRAPETAISHSVCQKDE